MPALQSITFTSTDASKGALNVDTSNQVTTSIATSGTDIILRNTTTASDLHYNLNMPVGLYAFSWNRRHFDIIASPSSTIMTAVGAVFVGIGSNVAINVRCPNPQPATDYTMTNSSFATYIVFLNGSNNLKHSATGF